MSEVRRVRLLGPLAVDGREVPGSRLRALLVPLLLARGRVVTAGALREEVWGADPPADPPGALHALVSRARRVTGLALEVVEGGYRVPAASVEVDALLAEDALREARAALRTGDVGAARAAAGRGRRELVGASDVDGALAPGPLARAASVRRDLLVVAAAAELAAGPGDRSTGALLDGLADLEQEAAGAPLDEPLAAALLRVLVALGRPAEALARYEAARRAVDAYGGTPSAVLRAAHAEALAASSEAPDPLPGPGGSVDAEPVATGPTPGDAAPAAVRAADGDPAVAGDRPPGTAAAGPRVAEALLGREVDLAALDQRVREHPLVTLVGPGGVGKTTLVGALVALRASRGGPVREVPLAGLRTAEDVLPVVLAALGGRRPDRQGRDGPDGHGGGVPGAPEEELRRAAATADGLLVLDNCEHLLDAVADVVLQVCAAASPALRVLATSRAPLGVLGEQVHLLGPLDPAAAAGLVRRRVDAVRPGADLPGPEVAELCRRLDHLPLALELAAAHLRTTALPDLLVALEHRFAALPPGPRGLPERHRSLEALVDWSWDLLPDPQRALLARMAVFPAGATAAAVVEVCADPAAVDPSAVDPAAVDPAPGARVLPARAVAAALAGLVDASLVVWDPTADEGRGRYRLLETVREYADGRLTPLARRAGEQRLARWAAALAAALSAELRGPGQVAALRRATAERDALAAALRRACADEDALVAAPLGRLLVESAWLRGAHAEVLERLVVLTGAPSVLDPGDRGRRAAAGLTGAELARTWRDSAETAAVGAPSAALASPGAGDRLLAVAVTRLRRALARPELVGEGLAVAGAFLLGAARDPGADLAPELDAVVAAADPWWRGWGLLARAWWQENGGLADLGLADALAAHALMTATGNTAGRAVAAGVVAERLADTRGAATSLPWWERAEHDHLAVGGDGDARQARLSRLSALVETAEDPDVRREVRAQIAALAAEDPDDDLLGLLVLASSAAAAREAGDLAGARAQVVGALAALLGRDRRPFPQLLAVLEASAGVLALETGDRDDAADHLGRAVAAALASRDVPAQAVVGEAVARWCAAHGDRRDADLLVALAGRYGTRLHQLLGAEPGGPRGAPPVDADAARTVEELDGPAAVVVLRELLVRALPGPQARRR